MVSGSDDKTVRLWNTATRVLRPWRGTPWVTSVALSADGSRVVSGLGDGAPVEHRDGGCRTLEGTPM